MASLLCLSESVKTIIISVSSILAGIIILGGYILIKKYQDRKFREENNMEENEEFQPIIKKRKNRR